MIYWLPVKRYINGEINAATITNRKKQQYKNITNKRYKNFIVFIIILTFINSIKYFSKIRIIYYCLSVYFTIKECF